MAITFSQSYDSRLSETQAELTYVVQTNAGESQADVLAYLRGLSGIPQSHNGLLRQGISVDAVQGRDDIWTARATFNRRTAPVEESSQRASFSTMGGTERIMTSRETVAAYGDDVSEDDFAQRIGDDGADVVVPIWHETYTRTFTDAQMTTSFKRTLHALTGSVNSSDWKHFERGECLFLGVTGDQVGDGGDWEVTFNFAGSPNQENETVAGISGVDWEGWHKVWAKYVNVPGPAGMLARALGVYVERVYRYGNFSALGLGS